MREQRGVCRGEPLSFMFTDLSSALRCCIRSLSTSQAMLNLPVPQFQHRVLCCCVPWL